MDSSLALLRTCVGDFSNLVLDNPCNCYFCSFTWVACWHVSRRLTVNACDIHDHQRGQFFNASVNCSVSHLLYWHSVWWHIFLLCGASILRNKCATLKYYWNHVYNEYLCLFVLLIAQKNRGKNSEKLLIPYSPYAESACTMGILMCLTGSFTLLEVELVNLPVLLISVKIFLQVSI